MHRSALGKECVLEATLCTSQGHLGAIESFRDITDRWKAEEALREREERLRLAWETTPDAFSISRLKDGTYVDVNNGYTVLTGYSREEVLDKSATDLPFWHDPSSRQPFVSCLERDGQVNNFGQGAAKTVNRCLDFPGDDLTRASIATSHDVEEAIKQRSARK